MEPTPIRDNGPYESAAQAADQFATQVYGVSYPSGLRFFAVLAEAAVVTGAGPSTFESEYLIELLNEGRPLDEVATQILVGWIYRARLAR